MRQDFKNVKNLTHNSKLTNRGGLIKSFYDLETWQEAHKFILEIYRLTKEFPKEELYGLISQIRRAAISVTANIAEGFERYHFKDKMRFYHQARGSLAEVQNFLLLSVDLEYLSSQNYKDLGERSKKASQLLNGLIRATEAKIKE